MNGIQHHIIRKQTLQVNTDSSDALALQRKISNLLNGELLTQMSDLFDGLVNENEWLIIEKLDIQFDNIREDELDRNFADMFLKKLQVHIEHKRDQIITGAIKDDKAAVTISALEKSLQALLYFLENGTLPWWYEVSVHADFEKELVSGLEHIHTLTLSKSINWYTQEFKSKLDPETSALRLTMQFNEAVFDALLNFLFQPDNPADKASLHAILEDVSVIVYGKIGGKPAIKILAEIKSLLLRNIAASKSPDHIISNWLTDLSAYLRQRNYTSVAEAILNNNQAQKSIPPDRNKRIGLADKNTLSGTKGERSKTPEQEYNIKRDIESQEGVIVRNAGLVIVTPFIPQLFTKCGILMDNKITDPDKAIAILHYIVWGNLNYREYDTVLNKVICNVDADIRLIDEISHEEQDEIDELLQSVISHWNALKSTSADGLRESFLQRKGKLSYKYDNWFLQVEQNTIDILLQDLPWTIGIIRLPWMNTILKTEWN